MNLPSRYTGSELVAQPVSALALQLGSENDGDRLDLRRLLSLIRRQLLVIATTIAICLLLAFLITQNTQRRYTADADILLQPKIDVITPGPSDTDNDLPRGSEQVETEIQFIQSDDLASKVYDQLDLARETAFTAQTLQTASLASRLGLATQATPVVSASAQRKAGIGLLARSVAVKRIGNSYALRLSVTNADPVLAAKIANGYATIYSGNQVAAKVSASQDAVGILRQRMEELRRQAQIDFGAVQQYRISNNLQSKSGTSLTEQEISAYNQQVTVARAEATHDAARLALARSGKGLGDATTSAVVNSLRSQRAALSIRVAELSERYLPQHPELVFAKQQLADLDSQITVEVSRAVTNLQANAEASAARLASLQTSLGGATSKLDMNNRALINLDDLERRAAASQALYESYLNRFKEVVAKSGAEQANSRLLSAASVPAQPSSPNFALNMALGLVLGVLLGTAGAVAVEGAYAGFTTGEDVERRLLVRCAGSVPLLESIDPHAGSPMETIELYPGGAFTESIRSVLAAIRQSTNSRNQVIAVTSAMPDEGKTTVAACLARTAAMAHERVAIIDCDVVRRNLSLTYGAVPGLPGLGLIFRGSVKFDAVPPSDALGGATLFAITEPFEEGARLLEQGKLNRIIAQLRSQFDLIILDCAPVLPIAETRDIVALADNAIVVTRWRYTTDRIVRAALKKLPLQALGDLGVVLNRVDLRKKLRFGDGDPEIFAKSYANYYPKSEQ